MTNQVQKVSRAARWTESTWSEITDHVAAVFHLTDEQTEALRETKAAQLIAAIPYLAGSTNPQRVAIANMAVYMMSVTSTKKAFNATPADDQDIFARLELARYPDGNAKIIERGMALIALNMLADYRRDVILDIANQKHNPIATGAWDYEALERRLVETIEAIPSPDMDDIVTRHQIMNAKWTYQMFPNWF